MSNMDTTSQSGTVVPSIRMDSLDKSSASPQDTNMKIVPQQGGYVRPAPQLKKQFSLDMTPQGEGSNDLLKVKNLFHKNRSKSTEEPTSPRGNGTDDLCDCDTCLLGFDDTQPDGIAKTRLRLVAVIIREFFTL